jgi:hypothetical protein
MPDTPTIGELMPINTQQQKWVDRLETILGEPVHDKILPVVEQRSLQKAIAADDKFNAQLCRDMLLVEGSHLRLWLLSLPYALLLKPIKKKGKIGTSKPKSKKAAQKQAVAIALSTAGKSKTQKESFDSLVSKYLHQYIIESDMHPEEGHSEHHRYCPGCGADLSKDEKCTCDEEKKPSSEEMKKICKVILVDCPVELKNAGLNENNTNVYMAGMLSNHLDLDEGIWYNTLMERFEKMKRMKFEKNGRNYDQNKIG